MKETKRTYPKEFKEEAVRLYEATEKSQAELERELGITEGLLSKWIKRLRVEGEQAFPAKGKLTERDEEIERLKFEIRILKQERDILKKQRASSPIQSPEI